MNKYSLHPLALACTVALLGSPMAMQVQAQENVLEEVLVTAQKREESIQDVAISIKALSAEVIERINADSLDDITRMVPSLSMTDNSRGSNNVQVRGLGSNIGSVNTVAIYNDGVIAATRIQSSGTFASQDSALVDIERVEVLRGPQGTLWGEGSFGGVINIISKRPDPSQLEGSVSLNWFSVDDSDEDSTDFSAMVNVPLISDKLALRLVGYRNDHGGWIDGYNGLPTLLGIGLPELVGEDLNTEEVTGGRLSLGYTGENFDATLILKHEEAETGLQNIEGDFFGILAATVGQGNNHIFFGPDLSAALAPGSDKEVKESILEVNVETPLGTLTSITGYAEVDSESPSTAIAASESFSEELRLSSDNEGNLNYTVGFYYREAERFVDLGPMPFAGNEIEQWAVFGQLYWDISDALQATFGLRYGEQDSLVLDLLLMPFIGDLARAEGSFDNVSPKIALDWQVDEDTMFYASVAKGFRAGGANIDESLGTDPNFSQEFDADFVWNYEVGTKTTFMDERVTLNAALFYIDWSDIQVDRAINSLISPPIDFIVTNGEDAHSTGIEADVMIIPADGWEIVLGGSFVEAEYDNGEITSVAGGFPLKGQRLPNSPEFLFNASIEKQFPVFDTGLDGFARLDYSLRGGSFADVPNERPGSEFEGDDMELLHFRAGIGSDRWEIQAYVKNLTDEDASSFNFIDNASGLHFVARVAPRTVGISAKLRLQ